MTPKPRACKRRGAALLIVLACLVIVTVLVVQFLLMARSELKSSTNYSAERETRSLADLAVNVVMAQVRDATTDGPGENAWASQPGAIRVWDNDGDLARVYKLYSAKEMQAEDMKFLPFEVPTDWAARTNEYVDINEPVLLRDTAGAVKRTVFPILNPASFDTVQGCTTTRANLGGDYDTRAAMPVRWLYVLRDGAIGDRSEATADNPIVGRISFWTDDDSSKININTASATKLNPAFNSNIPDVPSDSFWDVPYTYTFQDTRLGYFPPIEGEYQRYPGHPASVNLLTVLGGDPSLTLIDMFNLTPRYKWGGSENATISFQNTSGLARLSKNDRLYTSSDELRFNASMSDGQRQANFLGNGSESATMETLLNRWQFFLTAYSRSPDLNLFAQPRVCIWPISSIDDENHRTIYDNLMAFCTTIGSGTEKKPYYFVRRYPLSQTADWNSFDRNREVFDYLFDLTSKKIPGYGGNFLNKYDVRDGGASGEWHQILTEIFDYIRCVNLNETYANVPADYTSYTPTLGPVPPFLSSKNFDGAGVVLPIKIGNSRGAGRVPVMSEAAITVIHNGGTTSGNPINQLQSALLLETFSPMLGFMPWQPVDFQIGAKCTALLKETSAPAGVAIFPGGDSAFVYSNAVSKSPAMRSSQSVGGTDGFSWWMPRAGELTNDGGTYPFWRDRITGLPVSTSELSLVAGSLSVELKMGGVAYQTYQLDVPGTALPMPQFVAAPVGQSGRNLDWKNRGLFGNLSGFRAEDVVRGISLRDGDHRIMAYLDAVPANFFREHRDYFNASIRFAHGLRTSISGGYKGVDYTDGTSNGRFIQTDYLAADRTTDYIFDTFRPKIDARIEDLRAEGWTGDWNTGMSVFPDGAYLNKSDEGVMDGGAATALYTDLGEWSRAKGFFSPTRQIPSAAMFGSLPTGVKRTLQAYEGGDYANGRPWRTLLFCPNPDAGSGHFGLTSPPDYLLLDFFHLPVVEPYAISEPFSTAGRLNMNCQILPFTDISRKTALHAVLDGMRVTTIPTGDGLVYKKESSRLDKTLKYRPALNIPETLKQLDDKFAPNGDAAQGDLFKSAAEICSIFLIPKDVAGSPTSDNIASWWSGYRLTGDNVREKPYATLYPLLTTKSNTYTVHVRVQALKKVPGTPPADFEEGRDKVLGEYRGSFSIERYLDPNDERLPGGAQASIDPDTQSLESVYRFRFLETKEFSP